MDVKIEVSNDESEDAKVEPTRSFFTKRCYSEPIIFENFIPSFNLKTESEKSLSNTILEFSSSLLETTKTWTPFQLLNFFHLLPTEEDISKELETEESPQKFTEIDIASRTYFPLTFSVLLSLYFILYIYIIEDEIPLSLYSYYN
jgi:hypothetical protein